MKNILSALLVFVCVSLHAATVTFTMTNAVTQGPDTNAILIQPISAYINADGSVNTTGLPFWIYPNTNGIVSTNLYYGNYLATNSFICSQYVGPGQMGTSQGVVFAVPQGSGSYAFGQLAISGYNVYNYNGTAFTVSASNIFAAMGYTPLTPQQTTNLFLSANTNQIFAGTNVTLTTNGNAITIQVPSQGFLTNGLVTSAITNGFATTNFAIALTNGMTSITQSNPAAYTTPAQSTNIATVAAFNQGVSSTNFTLSASNSLNQLSTLTVQTASNALYAALGASNSIQAANLGTTSNGLLNRLQSGSMVLSNLAVTTAYTNQLQPSSGITFITNFITSPYTVFISANTQTSLTNGLVQWTGLVPSSFLLTNVLPGLTNGFITSAALSGLLSAATAATTYYPTSNPSGFLTSSATNSLASAFALTFYPISNPSNFISTAYLSSYLTSNQIYSAIQSSNANYTTFAQVASTNQATLITVTNLIVNATNSTFVYVRLYADTNGAAAAAINYAQGVSNYVTSATNYFGTNILANAITNSVKFQDAAGDVMSGGYYMTPFGRDVFGNGTLSIASSSFTVSSAGHAFANSGYSDPQGNIPVSTNIALASNLINYLPITNGVAHNLSIADQLLFGIDTNMQVSTACIGVWGGGSGNGGYYQNGVNIWTNYVNPGYAIIFSGGNYFLQSNGVTIYFNTTPQGVWSLAGGLSPAPQSANAFVFHCNGVQFDGYIYATNLTAQINKAIATLTNFSGGSGGTNTFIVAGYGLSNSISATGNTNTLFINTNITATTAWVLSVLTPPTNGISSTTASNIVANYGSVLFYPLSSNPSSYITQTALNSSNYTTLTFVTNLVTVTSNALIQLTGVTPTVVTNMILANAPGIAQSTLVGGVMSGQVTNMIFNSAGTNAIQSMVVGLPATNAIGNINGRGTNTTFIGATGLLNSNLNIFSTQGPYCIPLMTASNSPSGYAYADYWNGATSQQPFCAFTNGAYDSGQMPISTAGYVYYSFGTTNYVTNMSGYISIGNGTDAAVLTLQYSMDGINWTTLYSQSSGGGTFIVNSLTSFWTLNSFAPFNCAYFRWGGYTPAIRGSITATNLNLFFTSPTTNYIISDQSLVIQATNTIILNASNVIVSGIFNGQSNLTNTYGTLPAASLPGNVVTNDVGANAYIARNQITSPTAITAVNGQVQTAIAFGIYSNLVALVNFEPQFNPTNQFDFFGRPYWTTNAIYTNGGSQFYYTNSFNIGGFGLTNYTLVVTIDRQFLVPGAASGGQGFSPALCPLPKTLLFSFENTNTGSGNFVDYGEYFGPFVLQRAGGVWPYATNDNSVPHISILSQLSSYKTVYTVQKSVYCLSCVGGTNYLWINTLPCYQAGLQTITNPVTSTDLLQQVYIGISTNYIIPSWNGDRTNSTEVVESVMLFNTPATPSNMNMVYGSYQMAQWPDWYLPYQFTFGDSILSEMESDLSGYSKSYTNSFSYLLSLFSPPSINWMNLAQGGSSLGSCLTNPYTVQPFPVTPVSLLPQLSLGIPVTIYSDQGRNDQSSSSIQNEQAINSLLTQFATPYKQMGAKWIQIATPPLALTNLSLSVLASNLCLNTNIAAFNASLRSNSVVNSVLDFDYILSTNNMVMGGGQSNDGVHPYTNAASAYYQLAKLANGIPLDGTVPRYTGTFTGNGNSLSNLQAFNAVMYYPSNTWAATLFSATNNLPNFTTVLVVSNGAAGPPGLWHIWNSNGNMYYFNP